MFTLPNVPRRFSNVCGMFLLCFLLVGCGSDKDSVLDEGNSSADAGSANELDVSKNVLHARFTGDIQRDVTFRGDEVDIGYIPSAHGAFLGLGGTQEKGGRTISVMLGPLMDIPIKKGPVDAQDSLLHGGSASVGAVDDPETYSSAAFILFYDRSGDGSDGQSTLTFSKVDEEKSSESFLKRYHLVGNFTIHTAYQPEPLSEPCEHDATMASLAGNGRLPRFDASLCKAKRADVSADFDIRIEVLSGKSNR